MSRRVRHIYAQNNEHVVVHRKTGKSSSGSGLSTLIAIIALMYFLGSC